MAEMMIAIIILGLGLLMVATMFPVAWTRARDLAEFTNQTTATLAATVTVEMLTAVAKQVPNPTPPPQFLITQTSFFGDFDTGGAAASVDTYVHQLHLQNHFATPPVGIGPLTGEFNDSTLADISIDSFLVAGLFPLPPVQVALHDRVVPPMPASPVVPPAPPALLAQWNQQLANRRFCWGVLHKMDAAPATPMDTRSMTMYFVTLRRTQSTHRFARQDPGVSTPIVVPRALPPTEDVLFPVPWLVSLKLLGNWATISGLGCKPDLRGIPSEAVANPGLSASGRLTGQLLQPGSVLIDRMTGAVFTVKQHRFTGSDSSYDYQATVTLDREISLLDVDDNGDCVLVGGAYPSEEERAFWVFPPPVARGDGAPDEFPHFDGKQPVVGIETRQMVFTP